METHLDEDSDDLNVHDWDDLVFPRITEGEEEEEEEDEEEEQEEEEEPEGNEAAGSSMSPGRLRGFAELGDCEFALAPDDVLEGDPKASSRGRLDSAELFDELRREAALPLTHVALAPDSGSSSSMSPGPSRIVSLKSVGGGMLVPDWKEVLGADERLSARRSKPKPESASAAATQPAPAAPAAEQPAPATAAAEQPAPATATAEQPGPTAGIFHQK